MNKMMQALSYRSRDLAISSFTSPTALSTV